MPYRVNLTPRALRDMESIYEFIAAEHSESTFAWFNGLASTLFSLEHLPDRGTTTPENRTLRQLLLGSRPRTYRIIYKIDKRQKSVNVLHIRHAARDAFLSDPSNP